MDLWVALAAAGAAYVANNLKKFNKEKESSSELIVGDAKVVTPQSASLKGKHIETGSPFRSLAQILISQEDNSNRIYSEENAGSVSSGHVNDDLSQLIAEELGINGIGRNSENLYNEPCMTESVSQYDCKTNKSSLRSRRSKLRVMKPLTSLDSCVMAQIYGHQAKMDEYVLRCLPSPSAPSVRPFIVTDGRRIIGGDGVNSLNLNCGARKSRLQKQMSLDDNKILYGDPSLPYNMSLEAPRRRSAKTKGLSGKLSSSLATGKQSYSLADSANGALLFGLGVSVGLISSLLANKRELDKLNGLLKQTENLVQDLQDELDMKDQLTVKELPIEDIDSQGNNSESYNKRELQSFSVKLDGSDMNNGQSVLDQRGEDFESMGKIEAELEAELERLELNMTSSSLERRLSDLVESDPNFVQSDPNFVPDISEGELRPDMFGAQAGSQTYADQDGSGTSTSHPANYSVSHRELALRLHEVIQSRLEERVKELEEALEVSERKVQVMESDRKVVMQNHLDSESVLIPIAIDERNLMDQPVIINLSGEGLEAYNEAYDELSKASGHKEYDSNGRVEDKDYDLNGYHDRNSEVEVHYTSTNVNDVTRAESTLDWQMTSGDTGCSGTDSESDEEFQKLLIKQIVEKNRRNSFKILNVEGIV